MSIVTANELRVHGLSKAASHLFGQHEMDFWRDERSDIYMTPEQIGRALEYSDPIKAISNLFDRNRARLAENSVVLKLRSTDGKLYDTRVFNERGIYEIIRKSGQPKADQFYDFVYDVLKTIRKTGSYSQVAVPDEHQVRVELLKTALEHESRLSEFGERLERVEQTKTVDYAGQRKIQKRMAKKVYALTSDTTERRKYFSQLHREIRDRWAIDSYKDVPHIELDDAVAYIDAWRPRLI